MNHPRWPLTTLVLAAVVAFARSGLAQQRPPAGPVQKVDLTGANRERKTTFQPDGLAMEAPCQFSMGGQLNVRVEANLPDTGEFKVELASPDARVDVRNVRAAGRQGTAEVTSRFSLMSRQEADRRAKAAVQRIWDSLEKKFRPEADKLSKGQLVAWLKDHNAEIVLPKDEGQALEQCRQAYTKARSHEAIGPIVRDQLTELIGRNPQWFNPQDRASIEKMETNALLAFYQEEGVYDIIDQYLKGIGYGAETTRTSYKKRLPVRLEAVYQVLSGGAGRGAAVSAGLTPAEQSQLRAAISVTLLCRFYPAADPRDPDSQWFNGQRVACRAKGVASIRLEGRLDPAGRDRVDWWLLEGYDPQTVRLDYEKNPAFRVEPPYLVEGGARVRVVALGDKPVDYALELRPVKTSSGKLNVVIHESPSPSDRTFPY